MSKQTGGPAFPQFGYEDASGRYWDSSEMGGTGLTLRDHFAGLAMQGWLATYGEDMVHPAHRGNADDVARNAYALADAMLKARSEADHEK
ncbi:hypothetical protein [Serratia fonticola]|uniref:hypothetical protein n=1 Tax=Serratia fonticola TaxID=47917 RepID=UPI0016440F47|nr:hypothetical protein [Serratia fonticola]MBC3230729.1 hypothetical protein [Serratia fonticola]